MPSLRTRRGISRRTVLASVPLVQISALAAAAPSIASPFTPDQMRLIDAVVNRLIPSDELGPGAREAGVPVYLERSFAGHLSGDRRVFAEGLAALCAVVRPEIDDGVARALRRETREPDAPALGSSIIVGSARSTDAFTLEGDLWRILMEANDCDLHIELAPGAGPSADRVIVETAGVNFHCNEELDPEEIGGRVGP